MAFETVSPIADRQAGIYVSPAVPIAAGTRFLLRFTTDQWTDIDLQLEVRIERSLDGGLHWEQAAGGRTRGGARDKFGNLPSIGFKSDAALLIRATVVLNKTARLGFEVEVL